MSEAKYIKIRGAKEHNLQDIDLDIPRDAMVVVTGLSGSGKSSLAFDTIFAEGQRRYVESLSSYARQFLEQMEKPRVESIEGLPPTIAIQQRKGSSNPRSTVATTTEIYDYMRVLFARAGTPHCLRCKVPISSQSPEQIVNHVLTQPADTKIMVLAPLVRGRKGEHRDIVDRIRREGFVRARVNGQVVEPADIPELDKNKKHDIDVVVDRLVIKDGIRSRLHDSVETALVLSDGQVVVARQQADSDWHDEIYSDRLACARCGWSLSELSPRMFSFNSPYGACPKCDGLGTRMELDLALIVPDPSLPVNQAIVAWKKSGKRMNILYARMIRGFGKAFNVDVEAPFEAMPEELKRTLLYGNRAEGAEHFFEGVIPNLQRRFELTDSEFVKKRIMSFMSEMPCDLCKGSRLRGESLSVLVGGKNIHEISRMTVEDAHAFFTELQLSAEQAQIAAPVRKEVCSRLQFMNAVGLNYLTLDRKSGTLSGGEAQRIRLASQVGSGLVGVCYVLDEPSIGLHQRDNDRLLDTLIRLRDLGNTVIVVEHDLDTIERADYLVDIGPRAGKHGGRVVHAGSLEELKKNPDSLTGKFLSGEIRLETPPRRRELDLEHSIEIIGARENNLHNLTVLIPLGGLVCVTGVSGSGKSTLVEEILYKTVMRKLHGSKERPGEHDDIKGLEHIDKVIAIDQSPIGRTPRSNPVTYTGAFDLIRKIFAQTKDAKIRGYKPGRFSFNVRGGRCEPCQGQGTKKIEMHFLPDVYVTCEECKGKRFNRETLEVHYKGKSIADVLDMTVEEALGFFEAFPILHRILQTLSAVGLDYVSLGQSSTTLSGGEAQRIKLAGELGKRGTGSTLYILDEPTTGLHFADIKKLMEVLNTLVDRGNTVLIIEHNLDVIKMADYLIDLGPEGGSGGGRIVAQGTPEDVCLKPKSYTGQYLKKLLDRKDIIRRVKTTRIYRKRREASELRSQDKKAHKKHE